MKIKKKSSEIMFKISGWIILISWLCASICSWGLDKDAHFSSKAMVGCLSISALAVGVALFSVLIELKTKEKMQKFLNVLENICTYIACFAFLISIICALGTFATITTDTNIFEILVAVCTMVMLVGFILLIIFTPSEQKKEAVELAQPSALGTAELPRKQECEEDTDNSSTK